MTGPCALNLASLQLEEVIIMSLKMSRWRREGEETPGKQLA